MIRSLGKAGARKRYNTETAELIGKVSKGKLKNKISEELYKTKRGDHFIHGTGGSNSRWNGNENIIEVDNVQTRFWLRKHGIIL